MNTIALYQTFNDPSTGSGQENENVQTMTSLEIAELTGKKHFHVMEAIRKMEPAWVKVCKSNFRFTSRTIVQPNGGTREVPCYILTKTECLYIATKFNDEARAKLVLRWQELEMEEVRRKMSDVRCLPSPRKILAMVENGVKTVDWEEVEEGFNLMHN